MAKFNIANILNTVSSIRGNIERALSGIQRQFQPTQQPRIIRPIPEADVLNTPEKRQYVARDVAREQRARQPQPTFTPRKVEYPQFLANAPARQRIPTPTVAMQQAVSPREVQGVREIAQRVLSPTPTTTPQFDTQSYQETTKRLLGNEEDIFVEGTPERYKSTIEQAAKEYGVPIPILSALLKSESNFNPNAKSSVGALGIAQFMPATAAGMGINPLDPMQAIPAAAKYLAAKIKEHGSLELALAAYNAGSGNVRKYGGIPPFQETQNYIKKIFSLAGFPIETQAQAVSPTPTPKTIMTYEQWKEDFKRREPNSFRNLSEQKLRQLYQRGTKGK